MIALLISGTVVLCMGLLAVVYGVPIKEFSFGNTMILAGSVVSCTGLVLIGLSVVGRELRNLTRRLEAGTAVPAVATPETPAELAPARSVSAPQDMPPVRPPLRSPPVREDTLFARDQPFEPERSSPETRIDPVRNPMAPAETVVPPPVQPAERSRRNIMFSSHRRDAKNQETPPREASPPEFEEDDTQPPAGEFQGRDVGADSDSAFAAAWPQTGRSRFEQPTSRSGRVAPSPTEQDDPPAVPRERFQPPRRADVAPVTIVKSGVVDSMAYSLYSDGSIEAQMPEGMVRFASIDELRSHLDQRG